MCFVLFFQTGVRFAEDGAEDVQKQKQLLKDAAAFLVSCQIPSLVSDTEPHLGGGVNFVVKAVLYNACMMYDQIKDSLDHSALPMDGATLTEALHQRGINVRYLGTVLEFVEKTPAKAQLEHFYVSLFA